MPKYDWSGSAILQNAVIEHKRVVIGHPGEYIPTDLREWITSPDSQEIRKALDEMKDLPRRKEPGMFDGRAREVWKFVAGNVTYVYDVESVKEVDFWQFPAETLKLGKGDCEDCAFLLASLLIASGVSPFCVRVVFGTVYSSIYKPGGHSWPIYKDEGGIWRILEATLNPENIPDEWPAADDFAKRGADPHYKPDLCANRNHVWAVGAKPIGEVDTFLAKRMKRKTSFPSDEVYAAIKKRGS